MDPDGIVFNRTGAYTDVDPDGIIFNRTGAYKDVDPVGRVNRAGAYRDVDPVGTNQYSAELDVDSVGTLRPSMGTLRGSPWPIHKTEYFEMLTQYGHAGGLNEVTNRAKTKLQRKIHLSGCILDPGCE